MASCELIHPVTGRGIKSDDKKYNENVVPESGDIVLRIQGTKITSSLIALLLSEVTTLTLKAPSLDATNDVLTIALASGAVAVVLGFTAGLQSIANGTYGN